jgi:Pvc16 N-terminal domain/IPT/TIG domain
MSNFLAIATVTATLRNILSHTASHAVTGADAKTVHPQSLVNDAFVGVNIYLYQITPNAALRNADLPTRRADGSLMQRPQAALDLHYLFSFYGDEVKYEPQLILGCVVRTLHSQPTLSRQEIQATLLQTPSHFPSAKAASNLADSLELVRFTPLSLSLEELSKLWSVFLQTTYTLSVAYQGSVVLIESDETPREAPPVLQRKLYVLPFKQPLIESVTPQMIDSTPGAKLTLRGHNLRADHTLVVFGNIEVTPDPGMADQRLVVTVPSSLHAGMQSIQVIQPIYMGIPPVRHTSVEFESNIAAFVLRPTIAKTGGVYQISATATDVTLQVNPTIGKDQRVVLLLNAASVPNDLSTTYTFQAPSRSADTNSLTIPIHDVLAGDYLVRIRVDDADSTLDIDITNGKYTGPKVSIP